MASFNQRLTSIQIVNTENIEVNKENIDSLLITRAEQTETLSSLQLQVSSNDGDITALQGRFDTEEPKTSALQLLTQSHSSQILSNDKDLLALQGRLDTEEPKHPLYNYSLKVIAPKYCQMMRTF